MDEIRCWFCRRTNEELLKTKEYQEATKKTYFGGGTIEYENIIPEDKTKVIPICPICSYVIEKLAHDVVRNQKD